ncbi:MAG: GNAT family N-acetyltransferase [Treponema sp.]|nr:GNAT family N-acetyltransferase [Treponema sp.]
MTYEKAKLDDTDELTALRLEYLLEDYGEIPQDKLAMISASLPAYFHNHLNKDLFAFICRNDGTIAGCCFLYVSEKPANPSFINGKTGTVMNVYTRPQFRRQGIARELMKMLLSESEKLQLDFVELKSTDAGYKLYKSLGFEDAASKYHNMKYIIDRQDEA